MDHVTVFYHTSPFDGGPARLVSTTVDFPEASNDTLVRSGRRSGALVGSGSRGYRYAKAKLMTVCLVPLEASQRALIGSLDRDKSGRHMAALDACKCSTAGSVFSPRPQVSRQRTDDSQRLAGEFRIECGDGGGGLATGRLELGLSGSPDVPEVVERHQPKPFPLRVVASQVADATELRGAIGDLVGKLCEGLRWADAESRRELCPYSQSVRCHISQRLSVDFQQEKALRQ